MRPSLRECTNNPQAVMSSISLMATAPKSIGGAGGQHQICSPWLVTFDAHPLIGLIVTLAQTPIPRGRIHDGSSILHMELQPVSLVSFIALLGVHTFFIALEIRLKTWLGWLRLGCIGCKGDARSGSLAGHLLIWCLHKIRMEPVGEGGTQLWHHGRCEQQY